MRSLANSLSPSDESLEKRRPKVYLATNGFPRGVPAVEDYGELIPLTRRRIDPSNWNELQYEVQNQLADFQEGDYILLGDSDLVLLIAVAAFFTNGCKLQILDYDILTKSLVLYTYHNEEDDLWQRTTD
jgi:hypothetical protein